MITEEQRTFLDEFHARVPVEPRAPAAWHAADYAAAGPRQAAEPTEMEILASDLLGDQEQQPDG